jgi:hypothetical protein
MHRDQRFERRFVRAAIANALKIGVNIHPVHPSLLADHHI